MKRELMSFERGWAEQQQAVRDGEYKTFKRVFFGSVVLCLALIGALLFWLESMT